MYGVLHCLSTRSAVFASAPRLSSLRRMQQLRCLQQATSVPASVFTTIHVSLRCASRKAGAAPRASATTKTRKGKSKQPAARRPHTNFASSSSSSSHASHEAAAVHAESTIEENDVRMAMRYLMSQHLSSRYYSRAKRTETLEKEREVLREKHEERERRLMMKDENSLRLLGSDARAIGDGVVPLMPTESQNPYFDVASGKAGPTIGGGSGGGGLAAWRTLNPVGLAASQAAAAAAASQEPFTDGAKGERTSSHSTDRLSEEDYASFLAGPAASVAAGHASASLAGSPAELDGWKSATLATLCAPNLAVYDADRDFRLNSEEVVRQSQRSPNGAQKGRRQTAGAATTHDSTATVAAAAAATSAAAQRGLELPFTFKDDDSIDDLNADLPANAAVQLKQEFAEADDPDYTVALYTEDEDDDGDSAEPFQL